MPAGNNGIVQAVTGAGKTRLALAGIRLLARANDKLRVKVVVPKKSLLPQWKEALIEALSDTENASPNPRIGICGGGQTAATEEDYMLYVINSARYRLARQILQELKNGCCVLLIADECHNYTSGENQKIFEFLPYVEKLPGQYCSLGLSATANGPGYDRILIPALGKEIYHYGLSRALKRGTICEFAIWQIAVSFQPEEQQAYDEISDQLLHVRSELLKLLPGLKHCEGALFFHQLQELVKTGHGKEKRLARTYLQLSYKRKRQVSMAGARITCVRQLLKRLEPGKQILIFGESIPQIEQLYGILNQDYSARVGRYHSKMGSLANRNALERFRNGSLHILLACLYYLFVADSREEQAYFPKGLEAFQVHNLKFDENACDFFFPAYEKAAEKVLERIAARKLSDRIYLETLECLERGYLREDWLLPPSECRTNADQAGSTRERNYWICMEQMAKQSTGK